MRTDIHNLVKYVRALSPATATTDNTAYVSQIVDTAGFDGVEFIGLMGTAADADVTFTVLVEHGDASNLSDAAAVDDNDLLGVEAGTINGSGNNTGGGAPGFADDNKTFKIGYKGVKRYVRVTITPANNTGALQFAGIWALANPRNIPQATQVV